MIKELKSINKLSIARYILVTSCRLNPAHKEELVNVIGHSKIKSRDIYGPEDLNALLRTHPSVETAHPKLWLSSAEVMKRILHSATFNNTDFTKEEITQKIRVYVQNPSYSKALAKLKENNLLIISGPPGVGKTTLAEMICLHYMGKEWEFVSINDIKEAFEIFNSKTKQIFYFDDFLGKIKLEPSILANKESAFGRFFSKIRRSKSTCFVLTTRGYIYEEAKGFSEYFNEQNLDTSKYILDVGVYTRMVRAEILYNHLYFSDLPQTFIIELLKSKKIKDIVDHKNFNPRTIKTMSDKHFCFETSPSDYPSTFIEALNNPLRIWSIAFEKHLKHTYKHLLFCLFFHSERGVSVNILKESFLPVHETLSNEMNESIEYSDFEDAVKVLENSFIKIAQRNGETLIAFINPSLKDYLSSYLRNKPELITRLAKKAVSLGWLFNLWRFAIEHSATENIKEKIVDACLLNLKLIRLTPPWSQYHNIEISSSERILVLYEWWQLSKNNDCARTIMYLAQDTQKWLVAEDDCENLVDFYLKLKSHNEGESFIYLNELLPALEKNLELLIDEITTEDLWSIVCSIDAPVNLPCKIFDFLQKAVIREFEDLRDRILDYDESYLEDHHMFLIDLGEKFKVPSWLYDGPMAELDELIAESRDNQSHYRPSPSEKLANSSYSHNDYDDKSLEDKFDSLYDREYSTIG